jgi:hypothetical protein
MLPCCLRISRPSQAFPDLRLSSDTDSVDRYYSYLELDVTAHDYPPHPVLPRPCHTVSVGVPNRVARQ